MLLQVAQVSKLDRPHKADLRTLREWIRGQQPGEGGNFPKMYESFTWHETFNSDFIAVACRDERTDLWSSTISDIIIDTYHSLLGHRLKVGNDVLEDKGMDR